LGCPDPSDAADLDRKDASEPTRRALADRLLQPLFDRMSNAALRSAVGHLSGT
jgi:hypothetical protein